jgi:hypothetical protein
MPRCSVPSRAVMTAADSDMDILVDLDPTIVATIFDYAGVKDFIADMFDRPVDVVSRESLKPRLRPKLRQTRSTLPETERDSLSDVLFNIDLANSFCRAGRLRTLPGRYADVLRHHALP